MPNHNRLQGLLGDFAQGASNSVASNVSAPVDAIAWLLRKLGAGGIIGDAPVGGSDWMAQQGLTADPRNKLAGLLGESVGLSGPMVAAAKAPQIASGLLRGSENLAKPNLLNPQTGAVVYHGSPHQFDAFDASRIGTGEGAQAYGHGLYVAENPKVAEAYTGPLTRKAYQPSAQDLAEYYVPGRVIGGDKVVAYKDGYVTVDRAERSGVRRVTFGDMSADAHDVARVLGKKPTDSLYKVDLPDSAIAKMLDWDKPLSQQTIFRDVQELAAEYKTSGKPVDAYAKLMSLMNAHQTQTGENFYHGMLSKFGGSQAELSKFMKDAGVPGIRYLDGGSRAGGAGTSNYVVFPGEENALKILERNGKGLLNP